MPHRYKLGLTPRSFNPSVPHLSALMGSPHRRALPIPQDRDWTVDMSDDLGIMLNDQLGDCTSAAKYHARQVRTFASTGKMVTESDACVLQFYEESCGYTPGEAWTDQGGNMQSVLTYQLNNGLPIGDGTQRAKILAFLEVDVRNPDDIMLAIDECGLVDIGFNVPAYLMPEDGSPPPELWDVKPGPEAKRLIGAHDVILPGRVSDIYRVVSWGRKDYEMTEAFFENYTTEAYAIITQEWITATGKTPFGLSLADWEYQMQALRHG